MLLETAIGAGNTIRFSEAADFFRILECDADVNIKFFADGREIADCTGVSAGYAERFGRAFDALEITAPTGCTIKFVARLGNTVNFDAPPPPPASTTSVDNLPASQGAFTQGAVTVTNASGQVAAANAARRYLLIQNKDGAGVIYVNLTGAAATAANGVKVSAGGALEISGYQSTAAIFAIGDIASNANVVIVEG